MKRQRGQSLVELALCLPLFVFFLSLLVQTVQLFRCKLELVRLTREFGAYLMRQEKVGDREREWCLDLQHLAEGGPLQGLNLDYELKPLSVSLSDEALPSGVAEGVAMLGAFALGERLTLRCRAPSSGALRLFFPRGVVLLESAAIKTDPWKNPGLLFFKKILSGMGLS